MARTAAAATAVAVLGVFSLALAPANGDSIASFKSFEEAAYDCGAYYQLDKCVIDRFLADPENQPDTGLLIAKCIFMDLIAWEDATGVKEHVFGQFLQPFDCADYAARTQQCIDSLCLEKCQTKARAYESLRCYLREYGRLDQCTRYFIPLADSAMNQLKKDDYKYVNTSRCQLEAFSRGDFSNELETGRPLFVGAIRGGYVDPVKGAIDLHRLYVQFDGKDMLSPATARCLADVDRNFCHENSPDGNIALLYEKLKCLSAHRVLLKLLQEVATEVLQEPPLPCGCAAGLKCGCAGPCAARGNYY